MPITSITIENFKGIGDAVTIPIRSITLLFGKNSSGKSTALQALRYMCKRCDDLKDALKFEQTYFEQNFQEQLDAWQLQIHRESPPDLFYQPLRTEYQLLKAAHKELDPEDLKSIQKEIIKNIPNDDLSDFEKTPQQRDNLFESKDDWQVQAEVETPERRFTDLGDFPSLVHRHELDRKIRIRLEFDIEPEKWESLNDILSHAMRPKGVTDPKSAWIEMITGWDEQQNVAYLDSCKYALNGTEWICLTPAHRLMPDEAEWNDEGRCIDLNLYSKKFGLSEWMKDLSRLLGIDNIEDENFGLNENKLENIKSGLEKCAFEDSAKNILKKLHDIVFGDLDGIRHLGPVRDMPLRNLGPNSTSEADVPIRPPWTSGDWDNPVAPQYPGSILTSEAAWNVLVQDPQLLKKTNHYLKQLALGYSIRQSEDHENEIQLYDETHKIPLHPLDVGFGISQVIPVVVGVLDDTSQIFAVEQPELHVHPATQVALGDVFIDGIKNSNRTMLIETHSEHLLLRLLRRVRETNVRKEKKYEWRQSSMSPLHREMSEAAIRDAENQDSKDHQLTPEDLSVIYVRPTPEGVKFAPLAVTNDGDFNAPWPEGFFDERVEELL